MDLNEDLTGTSKQTLYIEIPNIEVKDEFMLSYKHKAVFLRYMKVHDQFIIAPHLFDEFINLMCKDLNQLGTERDPYDWLTECRFWINDVQQKYEDCVDKHFLVDLSLEDKQLIRQLRDSQILGNLTNVQLGCILDHLEIASDSPKLWTTISLEIEAITCEKKPEDHWRKAFNRFANQTILKENLIERLMSSSNCDTIINKTIEISPLEQRLLEFMYKNGNINFEMPPELNQNSCRICLVYNSTMTYMFEETNADISLADKLNQCSCFDLATKDDGLPQYICRNCIYLLDSAYQFKVLCEKTDMELKNLDLELIKGDTIENIQAIFSNYIVNDDNEMENCSNTDPKDYDEEHLDDTRIVNEHVNSIHRIENNLENNIESVLYDELIDSNSNNNVGELYPENSGPFYSQTIKDSEPKEYLENEQCNEQIQGLSKNEKEPIMKRKSKLKLNDSSSDNHHMCKLCGVICKTSSLLKIHKKSHSNFKPYECTECGKNFKTTLSLKVHMRSHTGERPYVCETCGKAFKTCSAINNHRAIHSIVKEFKCIHCSYRGSTKANLRIHDRVHSRIQPYECQYCPLKFSTASNMHKHIRNIHQKQKTHQCEQCGRSFFSKESCRKHMVTHSGVKPYSCTLCPMSYGWYNGLQKHMKIQHPCCKIPTEKSFFITSTDSN